MGFSASVSWTPGTVASGAFVTTAVTVAGVQTGQLAGASFSLALPAGVFLTANVSAANTVTVALINLSGGPVTLGSGALLAKVFQ